jgi:hypothetical protein
MTLPDHVKETFNPLETVRKLFREGRLRKKGTAEFTELGLARKNDKTYEEYYQPI